MIDGYRQLLADSIAKRDALNNVIASLQVLLGDTAPVSPVLPPPMGARPPQPRRKAASVRAVKPRRSSASKSPADASPTTAMVEARYEAIRTALKRNDGIATSKILRAAMPKESHLNAEQRDAAYRNTLSRLKKKGEIDRTGDTWSLVGIGVERA